MSEPDYCSIVFQLTTKCVNYCPFCIEQCNEKGAFIDSKRVKELLIEGENSLRQLILTGGEALLHHDFNEIVDTFAKNNKSEVISVSTAGINPDFKEESETYQKNLNHLLSITNNKIVNIKFSYSRSPKINERLKEFITITNQTKNDNLKIDYKLTNHLYDRDNLFNDFNKVYCETNHRDYIYDHQKISSSEIINKQPIHDYICSVDNTIIIRTNGDAMICCSVFGLKNNIPPYANMFKNNLDEIINSHKEQLKKLISFQEKEDNKCLTCAKNFNEYLKKGF